MFYNIFAVIFISSNEVRQVCLLVMFIREQGIIITVLLFLVLLVIIFSYF